jgi:AcrR family transcriptional regulator
MNDRASAAIKLDAHLEKSAEGRDSRLAILASAEALFAERGFFGVSVREITEHAGVRLASVNYHFRTKEKLFHEVVARRASVVNEDRRKLLAEVGNPTISKEERTRRLASAFVLPLLDRALRQGAGWKNYCRMMAQVANSRLWATDVIAPNYDSIGKEFISALSKIFPESAPYNLHYAYQFLLGTTMYVFTENGRIETISGGRYCSDDLGRIYGVLLEFVTAGMVRLCTEKVGKSAGARRKSAEAKKNRESRRSR